MSHVRLHLPVQRKTSQAVDLAGLLVGWGTWIRTKTGGVRVRCPTVRRSPTSADVELELRPCKPQAARTFAVLAVAKQAWQGSPGEAGDLPIPSNLARSFPYSGKMPEFDLRKSVG